MAGAAGRDVHKDVVHPGRGGTLTLAGLRKLKVGDLVLLAADATDRGHVMTSNEDGVEIVWARGGWGFWRFEGPHAALNARSIRADHAVRCFARFSSDDRANVAASFRQGYQQRQRIGDFYYVHSLVPDRAFPTQSLADAILK